MDGITLIIGTNRTDAVSAQVAAYYKNRLEDKGVAVELIDLSQMPADYISTSLYENSGKNTAFNVLRNKMKVAQKFVMFVPEYNGSFPGVLKAFIDGLEFPTTFKNKKCALIGISSGVQGAGLALSHLTDILNYCGTHVLAQKPKLSKIENNFDGDQFTNQLYRELIEDQIDQFLKF